MKRIDCKEGYCREYGITLDRNDLDKGFPCQENSSNTEYCLCCDNLTWYPYQVKNQKFDSYLDIQITEY